MDLDEDSILSTVAAGGAMDYSLWPALVPRIVARIEKIARDEFAMPLVPPPLPYPTTDVNLEALPNWKPLRPDSPDPPLSPHSSQDTNKENSPAGEQPKIVELPMAHGPGPVVEPIAGAMSIARFADWPQPIAIRLAIITNTIETLFTKYPPHTIQRFAELLLEPTRHYKTLPAYLHAVDRVVHVTSGANIYPLPPAALENFSGTLMSNGVSEGGSSSTPTPLPSQWATPGSDEALGGALLTPIPWLSQSTAATAEAGSAAGSSPPAGSSATATPDTTADLATPTSSTSPSASTSDDMDGQVRTESTETIEGPNGMGSVETVSVSVNGVPSMGARGVGVTQGELLRQEQKAGVVPVSQLVPGHHARHQGTMIMQQHLSAAAGMSSSSNLAAGAARDEHSGADVEDGAAEPSAGEDHDMDGETLPSAISMNDDSKPHARGPEEIGLEDTGPQPDPGVVASGETVSLGMSSSTGAGGGLGSGRLDNNMQGINVEAAVGRKAADNHSATAAKKAGDAAGSPAQDDADDKRTSAAEANEPSMGVEASGMATSTGDNNDRMDVDAGADDGGGGGGPNTPAGSSTGTMGRSREATPKREVESSSGGASSAGVEASADADAGDDGVAVEDGGGMRKKLKIDNGDDDGGGGDGEDVGMTGEEGGGEKTTTE